jgi:hypothetical protein
MQNHPHPKALAFSGSLQTPPSQVEKSTRSTSSSKAEIAFISLCTVPGQAKAAINWMLPVDVISSNRASAVAKGFRREFPLWVQPVWKRIDLLK